MTAEMMDFIPQDLGLTKEEFRSDQRGLTKEEVLIKILIKIFF